MTAVLTAISHSTEKLDRTHFHRYSDTGVCMERTCRREGGTAMNYNQYISMDPDILRGKPCIAGTRISVELILELLSLGYSFSDILEDYPQLTQEQLLAVLDFARERIHDEYSQERAAS
jgi:uncharacterized protein (DUF433 family)